MIVLCAVGRAACEHAACVARARQYARRRRLRRGARDGRASQCALRPIARPRGPPRPLHAHSSALCPSAPGSGNGRWHGCVMACCKRAGERLPRAATSSSGAGCGMTRGGRGRVARACVARGYFDVLLCYDAAFGAVDPPRRCFALTCAIGAAGCARCCVGAARAPLLRCSLSLRRERIVAAIVAGVSHR